MTKGNRLQEVAGLNARELAGEEMGRGTASCGREPKTNTPFVSDFCLENDGRGWFLGELKELGRFLPGVGVDLALEELEGEVGDLGRLAQHRNPGLHQHLSAGELGAFGRDVHISNSG